MQTDTETKPACLFEVGKIYPSRTGARKVRIVAIEPELKQPVLGIRNGTLDAWSADGRYSSGSEIGDWDLIPPTPPKKRVPLGLEDVPPGSAIRLREWGSGYAIISGANYQGVSYWFGAEVRHLLWEDLVDGDEILRPGGEWLPAWKEVDA